MVARPRAARAGRLAQGQARRARVEGPGRRHGAAARLGADGVALGRAGREAPRGGGDRDGRSRRPAARAPAATPRCRCPRPAARPSPTVPTTARPGARSRRCCATNDEPAPSATEAGRAMAMARDQRAEHCTRAAPATPSSPSSARPADQPGRRRRIDAASVAGEPDERHARRPPRRRPPPRTGRGPAGASPGPGAPSGAPSRKGDVGRGEDDRALPRAPARDARRARRAPPPGPTRAAWWASATDPRAELAVP